MYIMIAMKKTTNFLSYASPTWPINKQTPIKIKRETATDMAVSFRMGYCIVVLKIFDRIR